MTGRQDDRKEYDRTKDRQRILDEYMIDGGRVGIYLENLVSGVTLTIPLLDRE